MAETKAEWADTCGCYGHFKSSNKFVSRVTDHFCIDHFPYYHNIKSYCDTTNPKDLLGAKKVSITKLPAVAILHASHAMMNGADKFGPFNWRAKKVQAEIYIDAALRHITLWNEREECASDSGVHHLGHAIACLAILLDAQETGNLVDNRPEGTGTYSKTMSRLNESIEKATK